MTVHTPVAIRLSVSALILLAIGVWEVRASYRDGSGRSAVARMALVVPGVFLVTSSQAMHRDWLTGVGFALIAGALVVRAVGDRLARRDSEHDEPGEQQQ